MAQSTVSVGEDEGEDEGGDDYKEGDEDLKTRLGEAQKTPRHLLDSKGILQFFSLLFPQPQKYSEINTAVNKECSCLSSPTPSP